MERTILIADDDLVVRHLLGAMLEGSGFRSDTADCGMKALEMIRASLDQGTPYAAVFLDLMLGDLPGTEVLREIRSLTTPQPIPVIMLSANPESESLTLDPGSRPDLYLEKPFVKATVLEALTKVLA